MDREMLIEKVAAELHEALSPDAKRRWADKRWSQIYSAIRDSEHHPFAVGDTVMDQLERASKGAERVKDYVAGSNPFSGAGKSLGVLKGEMNVAANIARKSVAWAKKNPAALLGRA